MTTVHKIIGSTDFLRLLMSYLPSDGMYTNSAGVWAQAILTLRDRHEQEHPELFEDFSFDIKPGCLPYSREVSLWLTSLYTCVGAPGAPSYHREEGREYLKFPESFQEESRERPVQRLSQEVVALMQQFAAEVAKEGLLDPIRKN